MPPDDSEEFLKRLKREGVEKIRHNLTMKRYAGRKLELAQEFVADDERCRARMQHRQQMTPRALSQ